MGYDPQSDVLQGRSVWCMEPDDDPTTAEEIRLLREDQRTARSRAITVLLVLTVALVLAYTMWDGNRQADEIGDCFGRGVPIEQC